MGAPDEDVYAQDGGDGGPGVQEFFENNALVKGYHAACEQEGRPVSSPVEKSLLISTETGGSTFFIDAPGNQPLVFKKRINDEDMKVFVRAFDRPSPFLSRLDLSWNLLTDVGVTTLASGLLFNVPSLTSLSLRGNSFGPSGCGALVEALKRCTSLKRLDVASNPLGREGGLLIVDLLMTRPGLLELFLADTDIDIDVLVSFATCMLNPRQKLKVCDLANPRIKTLQEEHTVHLGRMLRVSTSLSEIYLGKHGMRAEGVRQLVDFLLENKTLRVLDLRCNEFGSDGAKHVGKLLGLDCQLTRLNLEGNRIGEKGNVEGAVALAEALLNNRMLTHLNLNRNGLCGDALQCLGEAVDQSVSLENIALFHNNWDQPSSYRFHTIFNDRARVLPLRADFVTRAVDLRIDVCQVQDFEH